MDIDTEGVSVKPLLPPFGMRAVHQPWHRAQRPRAPDERPCACCHVTCVAVCPVLAPVTYLGRLNWNAVSINILWNHRGVLFYLFHKPAGTSTPSKQHF